MTRIVLLPTPTADGRIVLRAQLRPPRHRLRRLMAELARRLR